MRLSCGKIHVGYIEKNIHSNTQKYTLKQTKVYSQGPKVYSQTAELYSQIRGAAAAETLHFARPAQNAGLTSLCFCWAGLLRNSIGILLGINRNPYPRGTLKGSVAILREFVGSTPACILSAPHKMQASRLCVFIGASQGFKRARGFRSLKASQAPNPKL
jgi:hypothetical protein